MSKHIPVESAPPVVKAHVLYPTAVYRSGQLARLLGLAATTLRREKRAGRIRYSRRAGRDFYLGQWVLEWLQAGEVSRPAGAVPRHPT